MRAESLRSRPSIRPPTSGASKANATVPIKMPTTPEPSKYLPRSTEGALMASRSGPIHAQHSSANKIMLQHTTLPAGPIRFSPKASSEYQLRFSAFTSCPIEPRKWRYLSVPTPERYTLTCGLLLTRNEVSSTTAINATITTIRYMESLPITYGTRPNTMAK